MYLEQLDFPAEVVATFRKAHVTGLVILDGMVVDVLWG
jgi:hypothetical protein